ncbi:MULTISPECIES: Flp family type IVb pilin [unclassified Streptomyces]|uniref:Flp family type IVb pilin n=1 Tax=unclassified Streptomyces TaxID=2593676 RepID=UPI00363933A1
MSDELLKAVTRAKVHFGGWMRARAANDRDRGQTAVEYLGIIVVVVAIVVAISGTSIGQTIKTAISNKIADLID